MNRTGTRVMLVFGDPIAHSLSPLMQNAALQKAGVNAVYGACRVPKEQIGAAVAAVRLLNVWGVNLTVPLKEVVCPFLDELDPAAQLIGAVNTIVNRDGHLVGYNTDVYGVRRTLDLDLGFDPAGKRVMILGAGGASRAAIVALCQAGAASLGIANRTVARAETLIAEFAPAFPKTAFHACSLSSLDLGNGLKKADLLINATSVGLKGDRFVDFPWPALPDHAPVLDIVYSTEETSFVAAAKRHGHMATGGLGMLAAQGEKAFELWTGIAPQEWLMRSCLNAAQGKPTLLPMEGNLLAGMIGS